MASLKQFSVCVLAAFAAVFVSDSCSAAGVGSNALASMPIREVTVFKDGHAFVLHAGDVATDDGGNVLLDYLPTPVIGTFWPYADDPNAKLRAVSAGKQRVSLEKTALSIRDLLAANVGARVEIREGTSTTAPRSPEFPRHQRKNRKPPHRRGAVRKFPSRDN